MDEIALYMTTLYTCVRTNLCYVLYVYREQILCFNFLLVYNNRGVGNETLSVIVEM